MSTAEQMQRAKTLIQSKRYDDARALLITIDHPKADVWLTRLNQMGPATVAAAPQPAAADKSFTAQLFITILLLLFWAIPGLIALAIFAPEAKKYPDAPGAGALILLNKYIFWIIVLTLIAFIVFAGMFGAAISSY